MSFWLVYVVVIIFSYNGGTWGLAQRFISVAKPRDAQKAALLSAILYLFYPIVIFVPAWAAPLLMPEYFDPVTLQPIAGFDLDQTYILVTQKILSTLAPGLIGLLVCSMFAATMSMIDSDINALAAVFTKDFYQRNFRPEIDDRALFRAGMTITAIFGIAVVVTAIVISQSQGMNKVFALTVKLFGGLLSPIAIPLMFGMIWKRPTARGCNPVVYRRCDHLFHHDSVHRQVRTIHGGGDPGCTGHLLRRGYIGKRSAEKEAEVEALFEKIRIDTSAAGGKSRQLESVRRKRGDGRGPHRTMGHR